VISDQKLEADRRLTERYRNGAAQIDERQVEWDDPRPEPQLDRYALYGLLGDFVKAVEEQTEADPAALLFSGLTFFGAAAGPLSKAIAGANEHPSRVNSVLIGATSTGGKGEAGSLVRCLFALAMPDWAMDGVGIIGGLASAEGLIAHLAQEGAERRLVVYEPEFARVTRAAARDGSLLSATLRESFDGGHFANRKAKGTVEADGWVAVAGHITPSEMLEQLSTSDVCNGFANRFLFCFTKRRRLLPNGGDLSVCGLPAIAGELRTAIEHARLTHTLARDDEAEARWCEWYLQERTNPLPGLLGSLTARATAIVLRLSVAFALLDGLERIGLRHLEAALAVWQYSRDTARHIFGATLGNRVADRILEAARVEYPLPLDRKAIFAMFNRNENATTIDAAIAELVAANLVEQRSERLEGARKASLVVYAIPKRR